MTLHNSRKLKGKMEDVQQLLKGQTQGVKAPHIHGITEHWGYFDSFQTTTHKWFGIDKPTTRGQHGGVGAFVINKLAAFTHILPNTNDHKFCDHNIIWLQTITNEGPIFTAIVYAPPNQDELLKDIITSLQKSYAILSQMGKILIMGDFNCRLGHLTRDKATNPGRANILKIFMKSAALKPLKNEQLDHWTCLSPKGQSVNDILLANKNDIQNCKDYKVYKQHTFGSDHRLLSFTWKITVTVPEHDEWTKSFLTKIEWDNPQTSTAYENQLQSDLKKWTVKYSNIHSAPIADNATKQLIEYIQKALSKFRNTKTLSHQHNQPPKNTKDPEIHKLKQERTNTINRMGPQETPEERLANHSKLLTIQNKINELTSMLANRKIQTVWKTILQEKQSKTKKTYWSLIKKLRKTNERKFPELMETQNPLTPTTTNKTEIVNLFSQHYNSVFLAKDREATTYKQFLQSQPSENIHLTRENISQRYKQIKKTINNSQAPIPNDVFNLPLDFEETEIAIKESKKNIATGHTEIPPEALHHGGKLLKKSLHHLFSSWWTIGHTPAQIQLSTITPIYKKGSPVEPKNYRPISLLDSLFKIYEKILEKRLRALVEEKKLLSPLQMGAI